MTDETQAVSDDEPGVHDDILTISKNLTAWRAAYGDDVVDAAIDHHEAAREAEHKAAAATRKAVAGSSPQARTTPPQGRTNEPKGSART